MRWTPEQIEEHMQKFQKQPQDQRSDEYEGRESRLQRKCTEWLKMKGFPYIHDNSRGKNRAGAILDLHIYLPEGRHVICELKTKGNKMSKEQKETYFKLLYLGHEVHEVRSYKRFLEIMGY